MLRSLTVGRVVLVLAVAGVFGLSMWSVELKGQDPLIQVLVYVKCADKDEELPNTYAAARMIYRNIEFIETDTVDPDVLSTQLNDVKVFLVPEQEQCGSSDLEAIGSSFSPILQHFVSKRRGALIGLETHRCGEGSVRLLRSAGLTSAKFSECETGDTINADFNDPDDFPLLTFVETVSSSFSGSDGTVSFKDVDGDVYLRVSGEDDPVAFHKTVGNGTVIVIGFDFYEYRRNEARILANAILWGWARQP